MGQLVAEFSSIRMNRVLMNCVNKCLLFACFLLIALSANAQDYVYQNSVSGIDIVFPNRFDLDFGGSTKFRIFIDGNQFDVDLPNAAEQECRINADSYAFRYEDGHLYHIRFTLKRKNGQEYTVEDKVTYRKPKLHGISVGVNERFGNYPTLVNAQTSAADFFSSIKSNSFFPLYGRGQSFLLSAGEETPSLNSFVSCMGQMGQKVKESDLFVFYYAGHGTVTNDNMFSFLLAGGERLSGDVFASLLKGLNPHSEKIIIVCSCYSKSLWHSIMGVPNVSFVYASDSETSGDVFAENLISLLRQAQESEMLYSDFFHTLINGHTEAGFFPKTFDKDFIVSQSPTEKVINQKGSRVIPAVLSVFPGGGQYYKHDYLKGGLMTGGFAICGAGVIVSETKRRQYVMQTAQTHDVNAIKSLTIKADRMKTARTAFIIGAGATCLYSIIDAIIAPDKRNLQVIPGGIAYNF